ncbi:coiled-coil domain-containing protein 144A-like [Vicugna pacos]|uniref:Coiled-coil domain-containing protein 144A-like n=1 Tax=Vicugna pacos TaxID=30538 RepID=A0ABM5CRE2_VICPA
MTMKHSLKHINVQASYRDRKSVKTVKNAKILHSKVAPLHDNSELHGDLKELPSNVTNNIFDSEEKVAPGASVSVGSQALPPHKEPSLESVFPSYFKSESRKYGCQSSPKLSLNENKLNENDKPDTEHVFNKNEEGFYNDRENEVRDRVPFKVKEDQEFDTKRKQKRNQSAPWKSDTGHAPQVSDPESLPGLWPSRPGEMKHTIQIKSHAMSAVSNTYKKTKPIQDQLQKPLLADNCGANNSKIMDPELGDVSSLPSNGNRTSKVYLKELHKDMQRFKNEVEIEENRNKSGELKASETMCDGNCYKGLTQRRKRGKTDDQQFPALQKGNSDRSSKKMSTKRDKI